MAVAIFSMVIQQTSILKTSVTHMLKLSAKSTGFTAIHIEVPILHSWARFENDWNTHLIYKGTTTCASTVIVKTHIETGSKK